MPVECRPDRSATFELAYLASAVFGRGGDRLRSPTLDSFMPRLQVDLTFIAARRPYTSRGAHTNIVADGVAPGRATTAGTPRLPGKDGVASEWHAEHRILQHRRSKLSQHDVKRSAEPHHEWRNKMKHQPKDSRPSESPSETKVGRELVVVSASRRVIVQCCVWVEFGAGSSSTVKTSGTSSHELFMAVILSRLPKIIADASFTQNDRYQFAESIEEQAPRPSMAIRGAF